MHEVFPLYKTPFIRPSSPLSASSASRRLYSPHHPGSDTLPPFNSAFERATPALNTAEPLCRDLNIHQRNTQNIPQVTNARSYRSNGVTLTAAQTKQQQLLSLSDAPHLHPIHPQRNQQSTTSPLHSSIPARQPSSPSHTINSTNAELRSNYCIRHRDICLSILLKLIATTCATTSTRARLPQKKR